MDANVTCETGSLYKKHGWTFLAPVKPRPNLSKHTAYTSKTCGAWRWSLPCKLLPRGYICSQRCQWKHLGVITCASFQRRSSVSNRLFNCVRHFFSCSFHLLVLWSCVGLIVEFLDTVDANMVGSAAGFPL